MTWHASGAAGRGATGTLPSLPAPVRALDATALTVLAFGLNCFRLGSKSVVLDESTSVFYAQRSLQGLFGEITRDPNQSLYYLILHWWVRIAGDSEVAIRLPSAFCAALAVGALCLLGQHLFDRRTGFIAALLLACNAFVIQYAQMARGYALLVLSTTLSSWLLVCALHQPSRRNRLLYAVAGAGAVYVHYVAIFVLVAHVCWLLLSLRRSALHRPWLYTLMFLAVGSVPALLLAIIASAAERIRWIPPTGLAEIGRVLNELAGNDAVTLPALLAAGCYGAIQACRHARIQAYGFVVLLLFIPIALTFVVSLARPMFLAYCLIVCVPPLMLFGATGIASIEARGIAAAIVMALVLIGASNLREIYGREASQNWRAAAQHLFASSQPGDGILYFPSFARKPIAYYARRQRTSTAPADLTGQPLDRQRVWLVIRSSDVPRLGDLLSALRSQLANIFELTDRREFGLVAVELHARRN